MVKETYAAAGTEIYMPVYSLRSAAGGIASYLAGSQY